MPTYEYECNKCGHKWEAVQSITDKPQEKCPICTEPQAQRLISGGTNFILKGYGWAGDGYTTK